MILGVMQLFASLADEMPKIEQVANYGVAGLLAFVVMYCVNRLAPRSAPKSPSFSAEDRQLLLQTAQNTARCADILDRLQTMADTYILQQAGR
jgi:hypothetical protein